MKKNQKEFFLSELKKTYPTFSFEIVKRRKDPNVGSDEPLYDCAYRESLKVDGCDMEIEWLPYVSNMSADQLEYILKRCKDEVKTLMGQTKKAGAVVHAFKSAPVVRSSPLSGSHQKTYHA